MKWIQTNKWHIEGYFVDDIMFSEYFLYTDDWREHFNRIYGVGLYRTHYTYIQNKLSYISICMYMFSCCAIIIHFLVYFSSWRQIFIFGLCYIYSIYSNHIRILYTMSAHVFILSECGGCFGSLAGIRFEIWYSELMMIIHVYI